MVGNFSIIEKSRLIVDVTIILFCSGIRSTVRRAFHSSKRIFTRESSYCFQRVLAIAILSVRPSVCPSVTRVDQSKTVHDRIRKTSPSAVWKTLVSGTVKLFHKFEGDHPKRGH